MAGRINEDDIRTLKERLDIVAVIQPYTALKGAGGRLMGRCPFHEEKTPSFSVDANKRVYHCFGCGVGGTGITFVQEIEGLTFPEAVEKLARQQGLELRYEELRPGQKKALGRRTKILQILGAAHEFYRAQLRSPVAVDARDYLQGRGLREPNWETFGLGWAPDEWDALSRHLIREGVKADEIIAAGLATSGKRGPIDRFRARVMFSIRDPSGRDVVAFGGRIMPGGPVKTKTDGATPKYINSPKSDVYDKSRVLYGMHLARREIVKRREVLVVEGYMDVIALHVAGMAHAVAPCGTALTEQHFAMLERMESRVTLALDADQAGFDAAERARERADAIGVADLGVLVLPEGKDPADLVADGGADAVEAALRERKTAIEFQIEHLLRSADLSTPEAKTSAYRETFPLLGRIGDAALRYQYVHNVLAPAIGLPAQRIEEELNREHPLRSGPTHIPGLAQEPGRRRGGGGTAGERIIKSDPQLQVERELLQVALQCPELLPDSFDDIEVDAFTSPASRMLLDAIRATGGSLEDVLEKLPDDETRGRVRALAMAELTVAREPESVAWLMDVLKAAHVRRSHTRAREELQSASTLDADDRRALMHRVFALEQELRALERRDRPGKDVR